MKDDSPAGGAGELPQKPAAAEGLRYDAFLSYAHEDQETVAWLHRLLTRFWVPGRKRRELFFDRSHLSAGPLPDRLREALAHSRYLIVCASRSSAASTWVDQEIAEFVRVHGSDRVLACLVGPRDGADRILPRRLQEIDAARGDSYTPDLRGEPARARGAAARSYQAEALALLPPLVGLPNKAAVFARTRKARIYLVSIVIAAVLAAVGAALGRAWWLSTPRGLRSQALSALVNAARTENLDDPVIVQATAALGRTGELREAERVAGFFRDRDFNVLARVAAYASAPAPDCERIAGELRRVDRVAVRVWPDAALLAYRACGGPWLGVAARDSADTDDRVNWVEALARTGNLPAARSVLDSLGVAPAVLEAQAAVVAAGGAPAHHFTDVLRAWSDSTDAFDRVYEAAELLLQLDRAGRLATPAAVQILAVGADAASEVSADFQPAWTHVQRLAAQAAGAERTDLARQLLQWDEQGTEERRGDPGWADGWAWRALAQIRLGDTESGCQLFAEAERSGRMDIPASRTWEEWNDIALAYALAGDWRSAFRSADGPGDARVRTLLRARLIVWYAERHARPDAGVSCSRS
ncbi:MAG TPA: toll/interleukin-1 receptor domain-containing protein [Longimicrobium sp.]|nr:toll/interleukin-1 receptor domain-containing protein [Longimicrobium sp.]